MHIYVYSSSEGKCFLLSIHLSNETSKGKKREIINFYFTLIIHSRAGCLPLNLSPVLPHCFWGSCIFSISPLKQNCRTCIYTCKRYYHNIHKKLVKTHLACYMSSLSSLASFWLEGGELGERVQRWRWRE